MSTVKKYIIVFTYITQDIIQDITQGRREQVLNAYYAFKLQRFLKEKERS